MRATRAGSYEVVKSLLSRGADANATDVLGETALMEAGDPSFVHCIGVLGSL